MSAGVTEGDLRWLRNMASRRTRLVFTVVLSVGTAVCFAAGIVNLVLASRYARRAGTGLWQIATDDVNRYRSHSFYSRHHVRAIDRFLAGSVELTMALVAALLGGVWRSASGRARRILVSLDAARTTSGASG